MTTLHGATTTDPRPRARRTLAAFVVSVVLLLSACSSAGSAVLTQVDPGEAEDLLTAEPGLVVLDIRTPEEVATGTLPGAIDVDFYSPTFESEIASLDRDTPYLVYCRSGNRSAQGVDLMVDLGFEEIYELDGGVVSWVESGRSLSSG